ncbi:MAG TPA: glycosyltransferase family 2 protein [Gemmatimonadaceae bacterium]|nr:glycosyltransferase family 2 protein [Gemmatimonadaceae bacterium]
MPNAGEVGERVTYLIASYNRGRCVGACLESVRRQTNDDWLAIVVDDASTDESLSAIRPFVDERIRLVVHPRNIGYIATLKRLIAEASTDIVAILDADDAIAPEATEQLLAAYATHPSSGFVYSRYAIYDATLSHGAGDYGSAIPDGRTAMVDGVVGAIRSFRRSAYARTPGLDDTMLYAEDRDLVYKLEEVTRPVFIDAVLYRYRDLPDSQSHDPRKRALGARNTWRARRAALQRRKISGIMRASFELHALADYVAFRWPRPPMVSFIARRVAGAARVLCRRYRLRLPS